MVYKFVNVLQALQADIKALSEVMSAAKDKTVEVPKPTTQTTAYVKVKLPIQFFVRMKINDFQLRWPFYGAVP